ncbi:N-alpha-acetyltransferase 20 isoform X8 [Cygnus olor]|uniref:N-alpha-acetyltransferase 20 isoform X8 n=1 Tax=Cygnus olor TaxID=8869 RepID=UPI001ADE759D|nr:N-alpha-acetyltransferase 20 isoform X8 [Cygnus olor]
MLRPLNGLTKGFCGHNVYYVHDVPFVPFGGAKWYMSPRQAMRELILPGLHFGGRSSSPPLGPLRGLLPSEGGAPATPRKAAAGVLQPRVFQEKEQPDCPSCPAFRVVLEINRGLRGFPERWLWSVKTDVRDRRKALSREMEKELIIPLPHPVRPEDATRTQVLWIAGGKFTVRESKRARVLSAQWSHLGGTELLGWRCVLIL